NGQFFDAAACRDRATLIYNELARILEPSIWNANFSESVAFLDNDIAKIEPDAQSEGVQVACQAFLDRERARKAAMGLANSARKPSPVVLIRRPRCSESRGSTTSRRRLPIRA